MKKKVVLTVLLGLGILFSILLSVYGITNIIDNIKRIIKIKNDIAYAGMETTYIHNILTTFIMICLFISNMILSIFKLLNFWDKD